MIYDSQYFWTKFEDLRCMPPLTCAEGKPAQKLVLGCAEHKKVAIHRRKLK